MERNSIALAACQPELTSLRPDSLRKNQANPQLLHGLTVDYFLEVPYGILNHENITSQRETGEHSRQDFDANPLGPHESRNHMFPLFSKIEPSGGAIHGRDRDYACHVRRCKGFYRIKQFSVQWR